MVALMLNKAITSGKVKGDLLVIDGGDYGKKKTAAVQGLRKVQTMVITWPGGMLGNLVLKHSQNKEKPVIIGQGLFLRLICKPWDGSPRLSEKGCCSQINNSNHHES